MVAWGLLTVALLGSASGVIFDLHGRVWWYGKPLHCFFTAIMLGVALYAYGVVLTGRRRYAVLLVLTIAGLGLTLGILWEFA